MNRFRPFALAPCCALLLLGAVPQEPGSQEPGPEGLRRVAPVPAQEEPSPDTFREAFEREFDREVWTTRLSSADLDARERAYENLLRRARFDAVARAFLEEFAHDPAGGELAWTARLALRELGRADFPVLTLLPDGAGVDTHLERLIEELYGEHGELFLRPHKGRLFFVPQITLPPAGGGSTRQIQLEQTPDGARMVITDVVDGEEQVREFTGESLERILEEHPELSEEVEGGFRIRMISPEWSTGLLEPRRYGDRRPGAPDARDAERWFSPTAPSAPIRRDLLGVRTLRLDAERGEELGLAEGIGLHVHSVLSGTIAHLLGVRSGDVLVELNGRPLKTSADITQEMRRGAAGVTLVWFDDLGQRRSESWVP